MHYRVVFVFDRIAVIDQPVIDEELRNTSRDVQRLIGNLSDRLKLVNVLVSSRVSIGTVDGFFAATEGEFLG